MNTEQDAYVPGMEHEGITVFMMGTVMVEYNRKPMPLMGNPQGKMLQLFLILLYAGDKGVLREELLDMLYGNGENTNPSGSLRAAVFRLRKTLEGCGLPEHEYIRTDSGIYLHCILEAFHGNKTVNLHNLAFFIRIQVTGIRGQLQQVRVFPVILHDIICHPETVKVQFLIPDPNDGYPLFSCQLGHELPLV